MDLKFFQLVSNRLEYLSQRQNVVAQNIANSDTPRYRPSDVVPFDQHMAQSGFGRMAPAVTTAGHIPGRGVNTVEVRSDRINNPYEISPSGNEVILEQQMFKLNQTRSAHNLALNLYRKHAQMLQMALSGGGGAR